MASRFPLRATCRLICASVLIVLAGCQSAQTQQQVLLSDPLVPSHNRHWQPSLAILPKATIGRDQVTVQNVRDCYYFEERTYAPRYYDKTYDLRDIKSVDFIVVPFKTAQSLAHTMLSFGFDRGDYVGVSVEARLEEGETYSPLKGSLRQYELMYVVADEHDLIPLRTEYRDVDVYMYRTKVTSTEARALFVDIMKRVNEIHERPEFYDSLTNNCTTNIVRHVNRLRPGSIPFDLALLLPGKSDRLVYDLGLLDTTLSFEETKQRAHVNELAHRYKDSPQFSTLIRR